MKMKNPTKRRAKRQFKMSARLTIRIPRSMEKELAALGKFEKRRIAQLYRACLGKAIAEWNASHPKTTPAK